jgi:mannose-6-phosphate isomerase-like protein (cupin superfamily)
MAYAGQRITNPVSGETITFRQTAADTGGELLAIDLELTPDGHVPGAHVHPEQEETFHVTSGTMQFKLGRRTVMATAGDTVVVPAGATHRFSNAGDDVACARVEVRPALRMEELLETTVALAEEGQTTRKGMPKPVHLALFVGRYEREVRAPFPPPWMVRVLMAPLAWIGRRRGHAKRYAPSAEVIAFPVRPEPIAEIAA